MMTEDALENTVTKPRSAIEAVMAYVQDGVRLKKFPEGRIPNEADICSIVGVSRTPVREAMKVLDAMGVVDIRRGHGTFVNENAMLSLSYLVMFKAAISSASPQQLFEARLMVERTAAELAATNRSEGDLASMREANAKMREISDVTEPDLDLVTAADIAFHNTIFDSCGNPLVGTMGKFVVGFFAPWIREGHEMAGPMLSVENHEAIIDAITEADGGKALESTFDRILHDVLADWQSRLNAGDDR